MFWMDVNQVGPKGELFPGCQVNVSEADCA